MKNLRIILTGGGTAGHTWPLLAVGEELKKRGANLIYLGIAQDQELVEHFGLKFVKIQSGKWRRYFSLLNFLDLFRIIWGFSQSIKIINRFKPDLILAKGGYVTVPVILAASLKDVPLITHESDVVLGWANRLGARLAQKVLVSWPIEYYSKRWQKKIVETGNPVRSIFLIPRRANWNFFEFEPDKPVILVMGGSLGAHKINQLSVEVLPDILAKYQLIHICGKKDLEWLESIRVKLKPQFKSSWALFGFLGKELVDAYQISTMVISRAGAGSLAEIAAMGKPSILIPLSSAAADHQTKNAEVFKEKGAAIVLGEKRLRGRKLSDSIERLMSNKEQLFKMSRQAKSLAKPNAAKKVAEEVLKILS